MHLFWKVRFLGIVLSKWLPKFCMNTFLKNKKPIHILFCLTDHYEPGTGNVGRNVEEKRVNELVQAFPKIADRHADFFGNKPKRTWFFPPHYHRNSNLKRLVKLCAKGYGEIELHLHHGKRCPDTGENLRETILKCIEEYGKFGIFGQHNGEKKYGFIHGDWALDNSRDGKFCGVNDELIILKETGCYADFTFPSCNESNPLIQNCFYYAKDDPDKPSSHLKGQPVERGKRGDGDLMIIQGPLHPYCIDGKLHKLRFAGDAIDGTTKMSHRRIDLWVKTGIHVKGKPNWVFIKTHTHGAACNDVVCGKPMDDILTYMEEKYNDGKNYVLHYVTARELFNIACAVEAGEQLENPEAFRNYQIAPPKYDSKIDLNEASTNLQTMVYRTYE